MSLRVLIAEDDALARIGLSTILQSRKPFIEVVGSADNGKDALALALRLVPDVLITDVRMPLMNGIELTREIRRLELPIHILLLSAHNDFEYVREGIRLGVDDYLLKLELEDERLISRLEQIGNAPHVAATKAASFGGAAFNKYAREILTGAYAFEGQTAQVLKQMNSAIEERDLLVVAAQRTNDTAPIFPGSIHQLLHIFSLFLSNYGPSACCVLESDLLAGFISLHSPALIDRIEGEFTDYMNRHTRSRVRIKHSDVAQNYEKLPNLLNQIVFFNGMKYEMLSSDHSGSDCNHIHSSIKHKLDELFKHIESGNPKGIQECMKMICDLSGELSGDCSKILHSICYTILYFVDRCVDEGKLSAVGWNRSDSLMRLIKHCKSLSDYRAYLLSLSQRLTSLCVAESHQAIAVAKAYVAMHFSSPDLSLESVAAHVGLTPAYLSRLFSQKSETNFVDYMTSLRIDQAKRLLVHTGEQVQEIGIQVGYPNPYYFSRLFKKTTGLSPFEYRLKYRR